VILLSSSKEKFDLSITERTFLRFKSLVGTGNDEEMMIRLCEELEKERVGGRRETYTA
jgi:hypothetical protein